MFWPLVRFPSNKEILSPKLSWEAKTSHRKTLQPYTNICDPVTHEKWVHNERDFAFWKNRKSDFPVFEVGGISLSEFALHNRCGNFSLFHIQKDKDKIKSVSFLFFLHCGDALETTKQLHKDTQNSNAVIHLLSSKNRLNSSSNPIC